MTTIIAMVQTKGGVGKTTSAIFLGCALATTGATVELWDTDIQGSATDWADRAIDSGNPLPFNVEIVNLAKMKRLAAGTTADYLVIDTPPGDPATIDAVIRLADVVIMPTEAAVMDLNRLWATNESIPSDTSRIVLVTKANERTRAYREALELLDENNLATFSTPIKHKQTFKTIMGENPSDLMGYEEIATELMEALS